MNENKGNNFFNYSLKFEKEFPVNTYKFIQ